MTTKADRLFDLITDFINDDDLTRAEVIDCIEDAYQLALALAENQYEERPSALDHPSLTAAERAS